MNVPAYSLRDYELLDIDEDEGYMTLADINNGSIREDLKLPEEE